MDRYREQGQTLVELAIVLPIFCFGVFTAVQVGRIIHNQVELQQMASVASASITPDNCQRVSAYPRFHSLTRLTDPPILSRHAAGIGRWRPFKSVADPILQGMVKTVQAPGRLVHLSVETSLHSGGGFTRILPRVTQRAFAETLLEPDIPKE